MSEVKTEAKQLMKHLQALSESVSPDIEALKSVVHRTFDIVADSRYKVVSIFALNEPISMFM